MNKRKTTSIALAAAVAISTVQLAYPANVFANEQVKESKIENLKEVENSTVQVSRKSQKFEVSDEKGLRDAIDKANGTKENPTVITVTNDITLTNNLIIPKNKNIVLQGINEKISIKLFENVELPTEVQSSKDYGMISLEPTEIKYNVDKEFGNSSITIKNLTIDGNNKARIIYSGVGNEITLENGATLQNGYAYHPNFNPEKNIAGHDGGAIRLVANSNLTVNGAKLIENESTRYGGAIFCWAEGANITINDAYIANNKSFWGGGGIATYNGSLILKGGEITKNTGKDVGGIHVGSASKTYMSGNVKVYDNLSTLPNSTKGIYDIYVDNKILLNDKFIGIANFIKRGVNNNDISKVGDVWVSGDNYTITQEDASHIDILEENKILNLEENNLVVRNAAEVTFNSNIGADSEEKTQKVAKNNEGDTTLKTSLLKNTFTREGYTFLGWATKAEGEVVYKDGDSISTDKDTTLYAKWIENNKTITYDPDAETSLGLGSSKITAKVKDGTDVISITDGKIKTIGVGDATIEYSVDERFITEQKITVEPRETDIAIVNKIPYDNFENVINNLNSNQNITIINNDKIKDGIELSKTIEITEKNNITIDFNGIKLSKKDSAKTADNTNCLIKITDSTGIKIEDANFDLSNGEEVAILVDGTNNVSNVTLDGKVKATRKSSTSTGKEEEAPVVKMVGANSGVNIEEGAKLNDDLTPNIGKEDDASIILGKDSLASNIDNKNISSSSGGGNYIPSKPTYTHEEIIGSDRYDTAAKIADKLGSYDNVVLVNAESSMSDGLSASGLAGKENGAILLTKKDSIPKVTMDRIKKVKKVYIIGGEAAISQKVSDEITKNVPNVKIERLGGKDRVETSEIVAKKLGNYSDAFVVNGFKGEADAMSASAIAAKKGAPILLTNGKTSTHAKKSGVEYYVIGGNSVVDKSIADKYNAEVLAGKDRYATNKEVINEFYSGSDKVYIANGDKLVDALTASPLAKKDGIVLVNEKSDKSILKGKDTVQVGGMDFEIEFEK